MDSVISGLYLAWFALGFPVTFVALKTLSRMDDEQYKVARVIPASIALVWFGSAIVMRPYWLWVRSDLFRPFLGPEVGVHPLIMLGATMAIMGGLGLVHGLGSMVAGTRTSTYALALCLAAFTLGYWLNLEGIL